MASAKMEEHIRGILTEYHNVRATADENIELRHELKTLREIFKASSAEYETALRSLRIDVSEKAMHGPNNAMEYSKLQHEIKRLQSLTERQAKELQGAKDNIKRLQALSSDNSNNIRAQKDQLQHMQTTLSELEVDHMYSKSSMFVNQEHTHDEHFQEDHTEEVVRGSSMTLQDHPMDQSKLDSPDPLQLTTRKESNTKRKNSPLELFINGDYSKRAKSTAFNSMEGEASVSDGEQESEADDRPGSATDVLASKSKAPITSIHTSQDEKRDDAVEDQPMASAETTNPDVSGGVSEVEQHSKTASMKSGKKPIAQKLDKNGPQLQTKASSKPSKDSEHNPRNHDPPVLPTEASPHLPRRSLSPIVPVFQTVTDKKVSFASTPQVADSQDGQAYPGDMSTMGPKRSKRVAKPRVLDGSVPWATLPPGILFR